MKEANPFTLEIKPVAVFLDQGKVITQEFVSRDGHTLAGYRTSPDAGRFPAWERRGDIVEGFRETTRRWFPSADAARAWVLTQVNGEHQSAPVSSDVTGGAQPEGEAA